MNGWQFKPKRQLHFIPETDINIQSPAPSVLLSRVARQHTHTYTFTPGHAQKPDIDYQASSQFPLSCCQDSWDGKLQELLVVSQGPCSLIRIGAASRVFHQQPFSGLQQRADPPWRWLLLAGSINPGPIDLHEIQYAILLFNLQGGESADLKNSTQ